MAYFAELDENNNVVDIVFMDNIQTMTNEGEEDETIGAARLPIRAEGHRWLRYSWNMEGGVHARGKTPWRANRAGIGFKYDSVNDIFHAPAAYDWFGNECPNHTLNTATGLWEPPIEKPTLTTQEEYDGCVYGWVQADYEADNTTGWTLFCPEHEPE